MAYMAFDFQKAYPLARVEDADGRKVREARLAHERGAWQGLLTARAPGAPVAGETVGNWSGIVDAIEAAGGVPKRVQAHKATRMRGMSHRTDNLDARGLDRLPRAGTLPGVWRPRGVLRDQREVPRTRMVRVQQRTRLKTRLPATVTT